MFLFLRQVPCTGKDRVITLVLIPAAVFIFANSARRIADYFISAERQKQEMLMLNKALDLGDVLRMDSDSDGRVSREEYTLFMLVSLMPWCPFCFPLACQIYMRLCA